MDRPLWLVIGNKYGTKTISILNVSHQPTGIVAIKETADVMKQDQQLGDPEEWMMLALNMRDDTDEKRKRDLYAFLDRIGVPRDEQVEVVKKFTQAMIEVLKQTEPAQ